MLCQRVFSIKRVSKYSVCYQYFPHQISAATLFFIFNHIKGILNAQCSLKAHQLRCIQVYSNLYRCKHPQKHNY